MARVILVSNRVVDLSKASQAGGVAVLVADVMKNHPSLWFGWNGKIVPQADLDGAPEIRISRTRPQSAVATISLTPEEHRDYYLGYSNSVLWPVLHNRLDLARFDAGYYERYLEVNKRFATALLPLIGSDDTIWVHDYHLIPLATELRARGVRNPIGFYLHVPVAPAQTMLAIPEYRTVARDLAAYDLVGLQTRADVANLIQFFEDSVAGRILQDGRIGVFDRRVSVKSFPVGINLDDFHGTPSTDLALHPQRGSARIIGVDRLDYTKGLPQKFRAFGRFLEKNPHYHRKVVLSQIAPPTRERVEAYADIRAQLESLSGHVNGLFGELDWMPIHYIHRSAPRKRLRDVYRHSRIGMFTPLRDGMNLVCKEYVAAQDPDDPGVLILSRFAGAAEELVDALIVNPYNIEELADAILTALEMDKTERIARYESLIGAVRKQDTCAWQASYLAALETAHREFGTADAPSHKLRQTLDRLERRMDPLGKHTVSGRRLLDS